MGALDHTCGHWITHGGTWWEGRFIVTECISDRALHGDGAHTDVVDTVTI